MGGVVEQRDLRREHTDELGERLVGGADLIGCLRLGLVATDQRFAPQVVGHRGDRHSAQQCRACVVQMVAVRASGRHRAHAFDVEVGHGPDITVRG
jgi:hypothetical protein